MSYSFEMHFVDGVGEAKAFRKAREVVTLLSENENAKEFIESSASYSPHNRYWLTLSKLDAEVEETVTNIILEQFVFNVFNIRFTYWPKLKLLGCCCSSLPESVKKLFKASVYFQNGTDQDYKFSEWKGIKAFEQIACSAAVMLQEDVEGHLGYKLDIEEGGVCDLDYYRRTVAYEKVYSLLNLDAWLYEQKTEDFYNFAMNAIAGSREAFELQMMVRAKLVPWFRSQKN